MFFTERQTVNGPARIAQDSTDYQPEQRSTRVDPLTAGVEFASPRDEERWVAREVAEIRKKNDRDAKARTAYPDGTRLFVQAKLRDRRRASLAFTAKARAEVIVLDAPDAVVAERVKAGATVVTPLGALAIESDDALVVYKDPAATDAQVAALRDQLSSKDAELEAARAELAALRGKRNDPDAVKPERLAKPKDEAKPAKPVDDKTVPMDTAPSGKDIAGGK